MVFKRADCLLEIGCEELPPREVHHLSLALQQQLTKALNAIGLSHQKIQVYATPRRLAVLIHQLAAKQNDQMIERRGPALKHAFDEQGKPTAAGEGFARSCEVHIDQLQQVKTDEGEWLVYRQHQPGEHVQQLLPQLLQQSIKVLPIGQTMRWNSFDWQFSRPVHWLVLLYGREVIDCQLFGQESTRFSFGHRFHCDKKIKLRRANRYEAVLKKARVITDFEKRQQIIRQQLEQVAATISAQVLIDDDLLEEVTGLVEWPVALLAHFDMQFLQLPKEVLIAAMQEHQKCFALLDQRQQLLPNFITVANIESRDTQQVITGNEWVMRARLADAEFFFASDKKQRLDSRIEDTKQVVYQKKLGSLYDQSQRLGVLLQWLAPQLNLDVQQAERAAELAKCDLLSHMVEEFPQLQGIMGYYYAQHDGEQEAVALALKEQYLPRFAEDELPSSVLGNALALVERIDTLVGFFVLGRQPTGDKDPYKLRRAALGIVRILLDKELTCNLVDLIKQAKQAYGALLGSKQITEQVHQFILERLHQWYRKQGMRHDVVSAVLSCQASNLSDAHHRIIAVNEFCLLPQAGVLIQAFKRVHRLLQKEENLQLDMQLNDDLLQLTEEKNLAEQIKGCEQELEILQVTHDYEAMLHVLAQLDKVVSQFFDKVMVMDDDLKIRNNRLALLAKLRHLFSTVANCSLLQI